MKKKMFIVNPKQFGYAAGYLYYCKYLKNIYSIDFLCIDQNLPKIQMHGINVIYLKPPKIKIPISLFFMYNVLKYVKNDYSLIFMVYFRTAFIIKLFNLRKKIVLDVRTGHISENKFSVFFFNLLLKFNALFFLNITILSESLRQKLKIPVKKSLILPLGAEKYYNQKDYTSLNLLYVGTLNRRNIHETVDGLALFCDKHKNIEITYDIFGFGAKDDENKLINAIKENSLEKIVKFHGRKNHEQLKTYFNSANIGISYIPVTAYFNEQPPTKTFEYILSGMVCLATETYENKKLITDSNGVICEDTPSGFFEALSRIYSKRNSYKAKNIIETLSFYNWENIVLNILKPYLDKI